MSSLKEKWVWAGDATIASMHILAGGIVLVFFLVVSIYLAYIANAQTGFYTALGTFALIFFAPAIWGLDKIIRNYPVLVKNRFTDAPGTARWGDRKDLRRENLIGSSRERHKQIYCGMFKSEPVYYGGDRMIVTVGPTRRGKDTSLLVPNLKHLHRSVVVVDPKAELAAITYHHRRKMGPALVVNPFGVLTRTHPHLKSVGFNPLYGLSPQDPTFFAKCMGISDAMLKIDDIRNAHWVYRARALATALLIQAIFDRGSSATMGLVNSMMTAPFEKLQETIARMSKSSYKPMAQLASGFPDADDEMKGVLATARGQTSFLNDDALVADMAKHPTLDGKPFDFEMMKRRIITVYIVLPDDMLKTHAVWLRIMVASALNALKRTAPGPVRPVLMLNEAGSLGRLEPLEDGMAMAAGKGITIWTIWQSLAQISRTYEEHGFEAFMSGAGVLNSFGAGDMETAKYLSSRIGNQTAIVQNYSEKPKSDGSGGSWNKGESPSGYPLMHPENIIALKDRKLLSWIEPAAMPFMLDAPGYWDVDPIGLSPNPYYRG